MRRASASAPGKLILLGEHAVVYGQSALAIPVSERRALADVSLNTSGRVQIEAQDAGDSWPPEISEASALNPLADMSRAATRYFGRGHLGVTAGIHSEIPVSAGMGSSAAVSVALVKAIAKALNETPATPDIVELAMIAERGYHGNPSGTDVAVVAWEFPILHKKGTPHKRLSKIGNEFHFLAANSGKRKEGTIDIVREVAEAYDKEADRYGRIFKEMGDMADYGAKALESGTAEELGGLMNRAQELLAEIKVSSPAIDRLVSAALGAGAAGAKLSGAGRGGYVIAALRSAEDERKVRDALVNAGAGDVCKLTLSNSTSERGN